MHPEDAVFGARHWLSAACLLLALAWMGLVSASGTAQCDPRIPGGGRLPVQGYRVLAAYPHDRRDFTQGLAYQDGVLYEGTGRYGQSKLSVKALQDGRVRRSRSLEARYFGEGVTVLGDWIYQLTWRSGRGFVYRKDTLEPVREFRYPGEGWGLTHDGRNLIMSDGSARLRLLDPESLQQVGTLAVEAGGCDVGRLNELEYVKGEIYANLWPTRYVLRIDSASGRALGLIDLHGLPGGSFTRDREAIANGIAYDSTGARLLVTGKLWPRIYHIALQPEAGGAAD